MIKVLIVDDSATTRELLKHILETDPKVAVIGSAASGEEAVEFVARHNPDVITMDIHMPKLNGLEATRRIMAQNPKPVVIVSSLWEPCDSQMTFAAIEAGALAVLKTPPGIGHQDHPAGAAELIRTVKLMSEVKVVKRWKSSPRVATSGSSGTSTTRRGNRPALAGNIELVAIGASTGGPVVIQTILAGLGKDFPLPIVIVQHMSAGFIEGFAHWLAQTTQTRVHLARQGEVLLPGQVYLAPDDRHLVVTREKTVVLSDDPPDAGLKPSITHLFRSVAVALGEKAVGVLLTGMGSDGARDLLLMRRAGAITIVQDKESCVIYGMPGEAVALGAASYVLPADRIAETIGGIINHRGVYGEGKTGDTNCGR